METSRFVKHVLTLYGWSSNGTRKTTFTIFIYTNILCIHTNGHKKKSTDRRKEMSQSHWGSGYYNVLTFDFHHVLIICVFFHCFDFAMLWHCPKYTSLFSRKTLDDYGEKKSSLIRDGSTEDRAADWFWSLRHGNDQDLHRLPRKRHPVVWVYVLRFVVTHLLLTLILTCPQSFHLSTAVCKSWRHHIPPQPSAQT